MAKRGGAAKERIVIVKYDATAEQIANLLLWMTINNGGPLLHGKDVVSSEEREQGRWYLLFPEEGEDDWADFKVVIKIVHLKIEGCDGEPETTYPVTLEVITGFVCVKHRGTGFEDTRPIPLTHWRKVEQILGIAPAE